MKKFAFIALMLMAVSIFASSCSSSRKSGCPGNPQGNYKFRG